MFEYKIKGLGGMMKRSGLMSTTLGSGFYVVGIASSYGILPSAISIGASIWILGIAISYSEIDEQNERIRNSIHKKMVKDIESGTTVVNQPNYRQDGMDEQGIPFNIQPTTLTDAEDHGQYI